MVAAEDPPSPAPSGEKTAGINTEDEVFDEQARLQAGELSLQEASEGGMGRHLGLFSTTFLM